MELRCSCPRASALLTGVWILLSLHNAGAQITDSTVSAQTTTNSTVPVPGWGIALLVMLSIMAALILASIIFLPLWCQNTENDCQDGISFYSPYALYKPRQPCTAPVQCEETSVGTQD